MTGHQFNGSCRNPVRTERAKSGEQRQEYIEADDPWRDSQQNYNNTGISISSTIAYKVYRLGDAGAYKGCAGHAARYPTACVLRFRHPVCFLSDTPPYSCLSSASMARTSLSSLSGRSGGFGHVSPAALERLECHPHAHLFAPWLRAGHMLSGKVLQEQACRGSVVQLRTLAADHERIGDLFVGVGLVGILFFHHAAPRSQLVRSVWRPKGSRAHIMPELDERQR